MFEEWDFYFTNVNDSFASIFVNLGIHSSVPDPDRPWLLWVWCYMQNPREDGLSSSDEADRLFKIEDALLRTCQEQMDSISVGRITTAGRREFYLYAPTADHLEKIVASVFQNFPEYNFDCGSQEDPSWIQYESVLYPSDEDLQRIYNLKVLDSLKEHGDPLTADRPVEHLIYFANDRDRRTFAEEVQKSGFEIVAEYANEDHHEGRPLALVVGRCESVQWNAINEVTIELFRLAKQFNATYDGWETQVMKEE